MNNILKCRRYELDLTTPKIMGILNVTPDSFYDGGRYASMELAVQKARELVDNGADVIEVGGQSFKPNFKMISVEEELGRVLPVIEVLSKELNVPICIDTCRYEVVKSALEYGVDIIDDIWGLQKDKRIAECVAEYEAAVILVHNSETGVYNDLLEDIRLFLQRSVEIAENAGISRQSIVVDPSISKTFGKTVDQQYEILRNYKYFESLDLPLLLATSRKSFLGDLLGLKVDELLIASIVSVAVGILNGGKLIRVHDVKETKQAVRLMNKIMYDK